MGLTKQARILTDDQRLEIWENMRQPHRMIAQICYFTASRVDEVCQLEARDITDSGQTLRIRPANAKRGKGKAVAIAAELRRLMDGYPFPANGPLFPRGDGHKAVKSTYKWQWVDGALVSPWNEDGTLKDWAKGEVRQSVTRQAFDKELRNAAELVFGDRHHGVSSHSFRRSMCDRLYREHPGRVRSIMKLSGHRSLDSFLHYIGQSSADDLAIEGALNSYV